MRYSILTVHMFLRDAQQIKALSALTSQPLSNEQNYKHFYKFLQIIWNESTFDPDNQELYNQ